MRLLALAAALTVAGGVAQAASARDQARETAASQAFAAFQASFDGGAAPQESVYLWSVRWLEAAKKTKGAQAAAREHLTRMQALAARVKSNVAAGMATRADALASAYYQAEAEAWLADAGGTP